MTEYQVSIGEEICIEPLGIPSASQIRGNVTEVADNGFALSLARVENPFPQGALLFLRPSKTENIVGWGLAKDVKGDGHQAKVFVQNPIWETPPERRARRVPGTYWAHVSYLCPGEGPSRARKTVGQLINLSISGVRIRLRSSIRIGEPVMLRVYIGEDRNFEAVGRVVRVVPGAETSSGGFEVGICFVRILRGYHELLEAVGASVSYEVEEPTEVPSPNGGENTGAESESALSSTEPPESHAA